MELEDIKIQFKVYQNFELKKRDDKTGTYLRFMHNDSELYEELSIDQLEDIKFDKINDQIHLITNEADIDGEVVYFTIGSELLPHLSYFIIK